MTEKKADLYQRRAIEALVGFYFSDKMEFRLGGYAGTGKSFVISKFVEAVEADVNEKHREFERQTESQYSVLKYEFGLNDSVISGLLPDPDGKIAVRYLAPTGKASLELIKKGLDASTVHSFLYVPVTEEDENGNVRLVFSKNNAAIRAATLDMVIVDEASMINYEIYRDLIELNVKIVWVGDHGQLPCINNPDTTRPDFSLMKDADFYLEHIHRYAGEIANICKLAREGKNIRFGSYGKKVAKVKWEDITEAHLLKVDQIICGKNDTRKELNTYIRESKGFTSPLPVIGDKLIIKKNNSQLGLINGLFAECTKDVEFSEINAAGGQFALSLETELDLSLEDIRFNLPFLIPDYSDKLEINKSKLYELDKVDYGYAITCHSAQGSQFPRPLVVDEPFGDNEMRRRWRYTAYSRAQQKLIIVS